MTQAILYDSSRCTACQACVFACKEKHGLPLAPVDENRSIVDAYQRAVGLDARTRVMVTLTERMGTFDLVAWEIGRKSCVHCADASCVQVCPTGALFADERTGFVAVDDGRCVACHLCALACPLEIPAFDETTGRVCKCDGCTDDVAAGNTPVCVSACPFGALAFGDREELVAAADERAVQLRESGFTQAAVLGVGEQGGMQVVQVLKYGVRGSQHEPASSTSDDSWVSAVEAVGPASVGVLGAGGVAATVALAHETRKRQKEKSEERTAQAETTVGVQDNANAEESRGAAGGLRTLGETQDAQDRASDATVPDRVAGETPLEAALRKRAAVQGAATPAASAAAAAAASGAEQHLYPVEFSDESDDDDFGDAGEDQRLDVFESEEADDTEGVSAESTGELYNLEEFERLLAEDRREYEQAHGGAKEAVEPVAGSADGSATGSADPADGSADS